MHLKSRVIVVGVDFSELSERAFRHAYELAAVSFTSEIHAISVIPAVADDRDTVEPSGPARLEEGLAELTKHVNSLLSKLGGGPQSGMRVYSHFRIDVPLFGITRLATEVEANVIVVGTHGRRERARWPLGSVAESVARHARCPVLMIPPEGKMFELPKIEPICSRCIDVRRSSKRRELWCKQHREHHGRTHTCHERDPISQVGTLPLVAGDDYPPR
jgi:nucleotide-binding universal stress UspA family protein